MNTLVLLEVEDLRTWFFGRQATIKAVDGVSFALQKGEILGLAGESGSGKSVTGLSILGMIDPPGRIVSGRILFHGEDLVARSGSDMAMVNGEEDRALQPGFRGFAELAAPRAR